MTKAGPCEGTSEASCPSESHAGQADLRFDVRCRRTHNFHLAREGSWSSATLRPAFRVVLGLQRWGPTIEVPNTGFSADVGPVHDAAPSSRSLGLFKFEEKGDAPSFLIDLAMRQSERAKPFAPGLTALRATEIA